MVEDDPVIAYQPAREDDYDFAVDFEVEISSAGLASVIFLYESFSTEPLSISDVYEVLEERNCLDAEVRVLTNPDREKKWVEGVSDDSDPEYSSVAVFVY